MSRRRPRANRSDSADAPRSDAQHNDGWVNLLSGLGDEARDRRLAASYSAKRLTHTQLEEIWRGDDMAARIIELLPGEMTREWLDVQVADGRDAATAAQTWLDDHNVRAIYREALGKARGFGGAGILVGANDGKQVDQPLDLDSVRSIDFLTVLDNEELVPVKYYGAANHPKFGAPELYRIQPSTGTGGAQLGSEVHESRIIRFDGVVVSRRQLRENNGWGDSVLVRAFDVVRDFQAAWGGAGYLLTDFSQGVLKIKELHRLLAANKDDVVLTRLRMLELSRSIVRALVVDADGEEFERKTTSVAGLSDLLQQFALRLSAAARTPVSLLMGQAPAGLNATGASDIRFWYDQVADEQETTLRPRINQLLKILFRAKSGPTGGVEPEAWGVKFLPLWQESASEQADTRLKTSQADEIDIRSGVLRPEEVAVSRYGGAEYSASTTIDVELREELRAAGATIPEPADGGEPAGESLKPTVDPEVAVDPSTALNGAQVTSMVDVISKVALGALPRDTGVAILTAAFPLTEQQAEKIMGTVGRTFKPAEPPEGATG